MAGPIRQPIDLKSLEQYIEKNVPEIKTPLDVKQVGTELLLINGQEEEGGLMNTVTVWLWTKQPYIPPKVTRRQQICHAQEAARNVAIENSA